MKDFLGYFTRSQFSRTIIWSFPFCLFQISYFLAWNSFTQSFQEFNWSVSSMITHANKDMLSCPFIASFKPQSPFSRWIISEDTVCLLMILRIRTFIWLQTCMTVNIFCHLSWKRKFLTYFKIFSLWKVSQVITCIHSSSPQIGSVLIRATPISTEI